MRITVMKRIVNSWKTTLLGLLFIGSGIAYTLINTTPDYIVISILMGGGTGLIFTPDSVLDLLKRKSKDL